MFKEALQKFLIYFFIGSFTVILIVGVLRAKKQSIQDNIVALPPSVGTPTPSGSKETPSPTKTPAKTPVPSPSSPIGGSKPTPTPTPTPLPAKQAYRGTTYHIPWGNVSVSIEVQNKKIVAVSTPEMAYSPPSQYAAPILIAQALKAGSADIQGVSGATYTSIAFQKSLESAISKISQ